MTWVPKNRATDGEDDDSKNGEDDKGNFEKLNILSHNAKISEEKKEHFLNIYILNNERDKNIISSLLSDVKYKLHGPN